MQISDFAGCWLPLEDRHLLLPVTDAELENGLRHGLVSVVHPFASSLRFSHLKKLISDSLWLLICFSSLLFLSTPPFSLSLSRSALHIALPQEVCEVGGSGGGGGEERTSPEISECDSFSCQEFATNAAEALKFAQLFVPFCSRKFDFSTMTCHTLARKEQFFFSF